MRPASCATSRAGKASRATPHTYERKTDYCPYEERRFSVRAVHRDPPDLHKLAAAYLRYTLVRYEQARAEREQNEPRLVALPQVEGPVD